MTSSIAQSMQSFAFAPSSKRAVEHCDAREWHQKGSKSSYILFGEKSGFVKSHTNLSNEEFLLLQKPEAIVAINEDGISMAVEKRVALFFQQATLCYGLDSFIFSAENADMQVGSSPAFQLRTTTGARKLYKREAAHSSTLPTLIAQTKDKTASFIFLKGSSSYYEHNATIGMSESVNGADELLDGKSGEDQLRTQTVALVNQVAQKILNPVDATKKFQQLFSRVAVATAKSLPEDDTRKAVLLKYIDCLKEIKQDDVIFDQLLGIQINPQDSDAAILRQEIYPRKYELLQWQETIESRIAHRMNQLRKDLGTRSGPFLEHILLKAVSKDADLKTFEKLFSKTLAYQELTPEEDEKTYKSFLTRIENLQGKHSKEISALISDIRKDFAELKEKENVYKKELLEALQKTNPDFDASSNLLLAGLFIS